VLEKYAANNIKKYSKYRYAQYLITNYRMQMSVELKKKISAKLRAWYRTTRTLCST